MNHTDPHILIVDDQRGIRLTMTGIIEEIGFHVTDVEDGYQAIDRVKDSIFDLVFLDIKMPGINGLQTLREINKLNPDSLVAMMTGFDVAELVDASFDEGAICVIHKPFEPAQIVNLISSTNATSSAKLPTDIGALAGEIKREIDDAIAESPIARVSVRIPDHEFRALRLLTASGPVSDRTKPLCSSASLGGIAYYGGETQVINDFQAHPLSSESEIALGVKSALAVPINSDSGRNLGSMAVAGYEADYFGTDVVERFRGLALRFGNKMEAANQLEAEILNALKGVGANVAGISTAHAFADINR